MWMIGEAVLGRWGAVEVNERTLLDFLVSQLQSTLRRLHMLSLYVFNLCIIMSTLLNTC